ncbi:MAG: hypothetical protein EVA89_27310, partial [Sandaracinaceae bacterium]
MNHWLRTGSLFFALLAGSLVVSAGARAQEEEDPDAEIEEAGEEAEADAESEADAEADAEAEADEAPEEDAPEEPEEEEEAYEPVEDEEEGLDVPRTLCHGRRVRRIRIRGNRRVSDDDVTATIRLRPGSTCRDSAVARDAQALWNQGFYDDIVVEAEERGSDRIDLTFRVRERPAIGRITFEGNDNVEQADLVEVVDLTEGGILSVPTVREQVTAIRDKYAEEGFFLARVSYRLRRMENNQVDVVFQVDEGERVTVRRVRFVGNRHLADGELQSV